MSVRTKNSKNSSRQVAPKQNARQTTSQIIDANNELLDESKTRPKKGFIEYIIPRSIYGGVPQEDSGKSSSRNPSRQQQSPTKSFWDSAGGNASNLNLQRSSEAITASKIRNAQVPNTQHKPGIEGPNEITKATLLAQNKKYEEDMIRYRKERNTERSNYTALHHDYGVTTKRNVELQEALEQTREELKEQTKEIERHRKMAREINKKLTEKVHQHDDEKSQLIDQQQKAKAEFEALVETLKQMKTDQEEKQRRHDDEKRQLSDQQQKTEAILGQMKEKMKKDQDEKKQLLDQQQKAKAEYDLKIRSTSHNTEGSTNMAQYDCNQKSLNSALKAKEAVLHQELKDAEGKLSELSYEIRRLRKNEQDYANRLESAEGEKSAMNAKMIELEQQLQREISFRPQEHTHDIDNGVYAMDGANPATFNNTWSKLYQVIRNMVDNMISRGALKSDDIQKWYYDRLVSTTIPVNKMPRITRASKRIQRRVIEHRISSGLATIWNIVILGENIIYRPADNMFAVELSFEEMQLLQPAQIKESEIVALITRTKSEFASLLLARLPRPVDVEKTLKEDCTFNPFSVLPSNISNQLVTFFNEKLSVVLQALSTFTSEDLYVGWKSSIIFLIYISIHLRLQMEAMGKQGRMAIFFAGSDHDCRAILGPIQTEQTGIQEANQLAPALRLESNLHNVVDSVYKAKRNEEVEEDECVFLTVFPGVVKIKLKDGNVVMDDQVDNQCTVLSC